MQHIPSAEFFSNTQPGLGRRALLGVALSLPFAVPAAAADQNTQNAVLAEVNAFRASNGKPPLPLDSRLSQAATLHSQDMLAHNQMTHTGSDGSRLGQRITRAGYLWRAVRENIVAGRSDARQAVMSWIGSPGHAANMLADNVTQIGVGHASGPGLMAGNPARHFWTLVLAAPR